MVNLEDTNISVTVGSLHLKSPLIIVSGVFGYGEEFLKVAHFDPEEAGAVVLKGITLKPWAGNPPPRIVETAAGMLNSIGLQNIGVEQLVTRKLPLWENVNTKVIINVAGHSIEEYVEVSKIAASSPHVAALELNLSCPNVDRGGLVFGTDPHLVEQITSLVRQAVSHKPVWVKLTPNVENIGLIAQAAADGGAAAVSLINTLRGIAIDIETKSPILSKNIGGLSGPAIKPVALLKVAEVYKKFQESALSIPIIGMGGVMNATDVLEFIIAGANAVGVGTAMFYDPLSIQRINTELKQYLTKRFRQSGNQDDLTLASFTGSLTWN
ncbi:dihydroorotate dehydrogenase [candidate division CSSED10-310 bacterium]|uniref:Dihydroorotate dehydrogenase n=1 Tax=candidate division CSSED10-310 bacterium TaxID=2855610 RepID=A0ABV6Z012_UNCC1